MTTAGPPDPPPGDESEGIRYFDFSEPFEPAEPEVDPFESEDPTVPDVPKGQERPKLARVRGQQTERPGRTASSRDVFEFALERLPSQPSSERASGRSGSESKPTFAPLTAYVGPEGQTAGQRAHFVEVFDAAREQDAQPFLALALRMPASDPASAWFPLVEQGIRSTLRSGDALLVDRDRLRLVAVLPGRDAEDVSPLLADLMAYLRERIENAAEVGHRISVFTALEGRPFQHGTDFLAEVYDKP